MNRFSRGWASFSGLIDVSNIPAGSPGGDYLDDRISELEHRIEDILIDVMQFGVDEFGVQVDTRPVAEAAMAMLDELRRNADGPLRPGLNRSV